MPFIGQRKERDDSASPFPRWISMVSLSSKTIRTAQGRSRAVGWYRCMVAGPRIKDWPSHFSPACAAAELHKPFLLSSTGFRWCSPCIGWVYSAGLSLLLGCLWPTVNCVDSFHKLNFYVLFFGFIFIFATWEEKQESKNHQENKTAAFVRVITRQQPRFHRWSRWVHVFYSDPLCVHLSAERKYLSIPAILGLILIPRLLLSLHNSWFSSKSYILWSHFLPFLLLLLRFLSDIAPPNKLNTQGLGQGVMFLYHPRWSKILSHFLFLFFALFWGNLISTVAFLFYGWRHNASCLIPQPGTTLGQGKDARAFHFISPAKLNHQPSTERLNQ